MFQCDICAWSFSIGLCICPFTTTNTSISISWHFQSRRFGMIILTWRNHLPPWVRLEYPIDIIWLFILWISVQLLITAFEDVHILRPKNFWKTHKDWIYLSLSLTLPVSLCASLYLPQLNTYSTEVLFIAGRLSVLSDWSTAYWSLLDFVVSSVVALCIAGSRTKW